LLEIKEHEITRHLTEVVITPEHAERTESAEFRCSKETLRKDGHYECWICGSTEKLQVHHYGAEWSLASDTDLEKLKLLLEQWDVYGYGRLLKSRPLLSVDDVRNMMILCQEHHMGKKHGIHEITFPAWIIQKVCKAGNDPIPEE
jgi:hypothetical protein